MRRATILILTLFVAAFVLYKLATRPALTYQGQTIDYWFTQLPLTIVSSQGIATASTGSIFPGGSYGSTNNECFDAFDSFGTNAFSYLLKKMASEDSAFEKKASQIAWRVGWKSFPARNANMERYQATTALRRFSEIPDESRHSLTNLAKASSAEIALSAQHVLRKSN